MTGRSQLYSTEEVARLFHVDRRTVHRWQEAGRIHATWLPGSGRLRVSLDGVEIPDGPLLRVHEVAEIFHVCSKTAGRWAKNGVLPAIALPSGRWRFLDGPVRDRLAALKPFEGGARD